MENMWAPWRMEFICTLREESGCFLCRAAECSATAADLTEKDKKCFVVHRGKRCFAVLNRYPYSNGHLLIAPYEHEGDLEKLPDETLLELMTVVRDAKRALKATCNPDGFNIGANLGKDAGAGVVDHLHLHIVPRWRGDTNFMPILADTKVIPQALDELCERLRSQWKASPPERG